MEGRAAYRPGPIGIAAPVTERVEMVRMLIDERHQRTDRREAQGIQLGNRFRISIIASTGWPTPGGPKASFRALTEMVTVTRVLVDLQGGPAASEASTNSRASVSDNAKGLFKDSLNLLRRDVAESDGV